MSYLDLKNINEKHFVSQIESDDERTSNQLLKLPVSFSPSPSYDSDVEEDQLRRSSVILFFIN